MKVQGIGWLKEILFNYMGVDGAFRTPVWQKLPESGNFDATKSPTTIALKLILSTPIPIIAGMGGDEPEILESSVQRLPKFIREALLRLPNGSVFSLMGWMKKEDAEGWYWIFLYIPVKGELQNFAGFLRSIVKKLRKPAIFLPFDFDNNSYEVEWKPDAKAPTVIKLPDTAYCVMVSWSDTTPPQACDIKVSSHLARLSKAPYARKVNPNWQVPTSKELADALVPEIIGQDEYDEICAMLFDEALGYAFTLITDAGYEDPEAYLKEKGILQ